VKLREKISRVLQPTRFRWKRAIAALLVALAADGLQILLLPLAWTFAESAVDAVAMAAEIWLLGFHPLLLPTFVVELIPVVDAFPTWTACVLAVIAMRKREEKFSTAPPPPDPALKPPGEPRADHRV
jgi:hypothetical protein